MNKVYFMFSVVFLLGEFSCNSPRQPGAKDQLPYLGPRDVDEQGDSVYHEIPAFEVMDQDSQEFSYSQLAGKIHVADFFFTRCRGICRPMQKNMKKLAGQIAENNEIVLISFTVDPLHDTPKVLREYIKSNGMDTKKWKFLTGDETYIHALGGEGYLLNTLRDDSRPGGFLHSEYFVLVDRSGHIRGFYDGTNQRELNRLLHDLKILQREKP